MMKNKNKNSKESSLNNTQHGGDESKKKTKTNSSKRRVGLREKLELKRNVQGVGSPFFLSFLSVICYVECRADNLRAGDRIH